MITNGNCEQQLPGGNTLLLYGTTHAVKHDAVTNNEKKRNMNTKFVTYVVLGLVSNNMIPKKTSQHYVISMYTQKNSSLFLFDKLEDRYI